MSTYGCSAPNHSTPPDVRATPTRRTETYSDAQPLRLACGHAKSDLGSGLLH
jgi:hypothetical protein